MKKNYSTRKPPALDNRVITAGMNCPYCRGDRAKNLAATVTRESVFSHFRCERCDRIFTVSSHMQGASFR